MAGFIGLLESARAPNVIFSLTQHPENGLPGVVGAVGLPEAVAPSYQQPHPRVKHDQNHHGQKEENHCACLIKWKIVWHIEHSAKRRLIH